MKKHLLKLFIVCGLIALSADLRAFTAVQSGPWSDGNTWGGVGPGSTVTNQDIIIPSGITVDLDIDVTFNGTLNSFWVTGLINGSMTNEIRLEAGTITGSGTIYARKLTLAGPTAFYSFTGPLHVEVLRNEGTIANLASMVVIHDTLDLEAGAVTIGSGADLQLLLNSNVRVNNGALVNSGGIFTTGFLYDVWYFGGTKTSGEELNSGTTRDIHVLLNSNAVSLSLGTNVLVNGTLDMTAGHVILNNKRLRIYGDLSANPGAIFEAAGTSDLVIGGSGTPLSSNLNFAVGSSLDELIISRGLETVHLESELTVTGALRLEEGFFEIDATGNLVMGNGCWISVVQGGMIQTGSFDGTQTYNVEYIGDSRTTGPEITGSGLNDLTVYLWYPAMIITLNQDLTIPGNFILSYGTFDMDTFSLRFDGDFYQSTTNSWIRASYLCDLTFSMSTSVNDSIRLDFGSSMGLHNLIIDLPIGSVITLASGVVVINEVNLMSGRIRTGNYSLYVNGPGSILNYNEDRYIETSPGGALRMHVQANQPTYDVFPVGTATAYAPVGIKQMAPALGGFFIVNVMDGVWTNGTTGTNVATSQTVVNKTWTITRDSAQLINMDLFCGWLVSDEMNGFDRSQCFIKNYYNSAWDSYTIGAATAGNNNTYQVERLGIPNGGVFVVVDNSSPLTVEETTPAGFALYPNPATDQLNVQVENPDNAEFRYELFDATGRLIMSEQNGNSKNGFDLSAYESGSYILHITNLANGEVITRKVIKS